MNQKPSIGRIVHRVNGQGQHEAAIITENGGTRAETSVIFDQTPEGNVGFHLALWHWPERD